MGINFRGYFKSLFTNASQAVGRGFQSLKMLNSYIPYFTNWDGNLYNQNIIRACIHAIASHAAKLTPDVRFTGKPDSRLSELKFLLKTKPNEYMTRFDFVYKTVSMLYTTNNVFIYTRYENNKIVGFYPVNYQQIEFLEYKNEIYAKFRFKNGSFEVIIPYSELIHIRRHYNEHDMFGSDQLEALRPILEVVRASSESMINAVKSSSQLRGILKVVGNLKDESIEKKKKEFVDSYMSISGDGIGAIDGKYDFIPTKIEPIVINGNQQKLIFQHVCMHFGVSEAILSGNYKEDEYNAFYNSVLESLAMQLSLGFTVNIFTKKEINQGNGIALSADKMTFANNATKSAMCRDMVQLGIFSINECRKVFELEPIKDGDKHIVSLNYVELSKANEYQGVEGKENNGK